jgi:hypothetical protein
MSRMWTTPTRPNVSCVRLRDLKSTSQPPRAEGRQLGLNRFDVHAFCEPCGLVGRLPSGFGNRVAVSCDDSRGLRLCALSGDSPVHGNRTHSLDAVVRVASEKLLTGVGYVGFRAATQIDAIWNAYLLALVIEIGTEIESARLSPDRGIVFSYRYRPQDSTSTLFDSDFGWASYHRHVLEKASAFEIVVSTDISDFYSRVYHHRLDNALS